MFTASRAKLSAATSIAKLRGQAKNNLYPQPEGTLGEHMQKHGTDLSDTLYGKNMVVNLILLWFIATHHVQKGYFKIQSVSKWLSDTVCTISL